MAKLRLAGFGLVMRDWGSGFWVGSECILYAAATPGNRGPL